MKYSVLILSVSSALLSLSVSARTWIFDAQLIDGGNGNVDITLFNEGLQQPGIYNVTILVNGNTVDNSTAVPFHLVGETGKRSLQPCLTTEQLTRYGVDISKYPVLSDNTQCADLSAVPQTTTDFDFNRQQLVLVFPPQAMLPVLKGIAPEVLWDDGMPALILGWDASTQHNEYRGVWAYRSDSNYIRLQPGLNIGPWRLRNVSTWQKRSSQPGRWQSAYTYAERGINSLKSRLTLGESYTDGSIFDSVPFRGVMLTSDENMVPYNQREFAPVIRGIARTQARVEVKQNGYIMTSTTVPAGPFEINDLPSTGSNGDLLVTILENDGSVQEFTVPYTVPAVALRRGYLKYGMAGGQYRSSLDNVKASPVMSAELMYGLPWNLTAYGGVQAAEHYQAGSAGLGIMAGEWGALSVDLTQARSQRYADEWMSGHRPESGGVFICHNGCQLYTVRQCRGRDTSCLLLSSPTSGFSGHRSGSTGTVSPPPLSLNKEPRNCPLPQI